MRAYMQIFFTTLVPLTVLSIIGAVSYFSIEYDVTKAIRIGVLTGVSVGLPSSFIISILLFISKKQPKIAPKKKQKIAPLEEVKNIRDIKEIQPLSNIDNSRNTPMKSSLTNLEKEKLSKQQNSSKDSEEFNHDINSIKIKIMLLMDKELAFEASLYAIEERGMGVIIKQHPSDGLIVVKTTGDLIRIEISNLTSHTSQVVIKSHKDKKHINNIIFYLKDRENSFLKY